jgi:rubrerythrin
MMSSAGAAPVQLQKRAGGSTDPLFNLSENISSQLQIALQPKLRQFSNNVHRNIFAGILPHDNEFVVTFGERSGMKTEISQAITSTWAKEQADMRKAVLDAIKQDLEHERQTIQDLNVAARRAREAVVKKIQGTFVVHTNKQI